MKLLVINGSPRGPRGNTEILTRAFLEGAQEVGAQAETIYLKDKRIEHCAGCFNCWTKTPGVCIHHDDMPALLEQVGQADLLVYAVPLYIYTVTGLMKDFMDRMLPMVQPFIEVRNGLCSHPMRNPNTADRSLVVISNCGFPEPEHFSGLKETFYRCYRENQIAGMICCAGGELLHVDQLRDHLQWYLDAIREAGRQVATQGHISADTQATLDRPLMGDHEKFASMTNAVWRGMGLTPISEETAEHVAK